MAAVVLHQLVNLLWLDEEKERAVGGGGAVHQAVDIIKVQVWLQPLLQNARLFALCRSICRLCNIGWVEAGTI